MINKRYLPSKNFVTALSIAVSIILLVIIYNYTWPTIAEFLRENNVIETNKASIVTNIDIDSDRDGLVDWKENLYGTDPKKADTDNDGTSDVQEIEDNRDPLKANTASEGQEPNDKIDAAIVAENKQTIEEYEKLNEMDKFSRNLVSNFIATQPVDSNMNNDAMNYLLSKSLGELPQQNYMPITKTTDLNLQKTDITNLTKNLNDYKNSFKTETQKLIEIMGVDLYIAEQYVSGSSTIVKPAMKIVTDKYQEVINGLIKMPVPVAIGYYDVNYHLRVINDLEILIQIDNNIVDSNADSLGVFSNIYKYNNILKDLLTSLKEIDTILKIKRI